jgi:hypothetical protein
MAEQVLTERPRSQTQGLPQSLNRTPLNSLEEPTSNCFQNKAKQDRSSWFRTYLLLRNSPRAPKNDIESASWHININSVLGPLGRTRHSTQSKPAPVQHHARATAIQDSTNHLESRRDENTSIDGVAAHESDPQNSSQPSNEFEPLRRDLFLASTMEVPQDIHLKWEGEVLPLLVQDRAAFGTGLGLTTQEINGKEELRMAGPEARRDKMKATIIISCRTEYFRRRFEEEINRWNYLKRLGVPVKVILDPETPRLAASLAVGSKSTDQANPGPPTHLISCQAERLPDHQSACGLHLKFLVDFGGSQSARVSTLGGLIWVGEKVYGLTTGHSIVAWLAPPEGASPDAYNSNDTTIRDSDHAPRDTAATIQSRLATLAPDQGLSSDFEEWRDISYHEPFAFAGQCFENGDLQSPVWNDKYLNSDWALVSMQGCNVVANSYQGPDASRVIISDILPLGQLDSGAVLVLLGLNRVETGFMSQSSSVLRMGNSSFKVRRIMMNKSMGTCTL